MLLTRLGCGQNQATGPTTEIWSRLGSPTVSQHARPIQTIPLQAHLLPPKDTEKLWLLFMGSRLSHLKPLLPEPQNGLCQLPACPNFSPRKPYEKRARRSTPAHLPQCFITAHTGNFLQHQGSSERRKVHDSYDFGICGEL